MTERSAQLYATMYLIRRAEVAIREHYSEDDMKTPMHMSMGEEAIAAGVCAALGPRDKVLGSYRSHALYIARTGETDGFFLEMYGRAGGVANGRGGSMHLVAPDAGLICTSAVVATQIPVALGAAYAASLSGGNARAVVFFGDGAIDEGVFWESLNLAALKRLPVLFVCEDNGYAVHNPSRERHGYGSIADVVATFRMNVARSASTDVEEVHYVTASMLESMQRDSRPGFLLLKYYRYLEHVGVSEDFNAGYRSRQEFERWNEADPLVFQRRRLLAIMTEGDVRAIEERADEQVRRSIWLAKAAPFPAPATLGKDLYA